MTARFNRIEGLRDGGDVRISGIKVGSIVVADARSQDLSVAIVTDEHRSFDQAVGRFRGHDHVVGLLGDNYLLEPGNEDELIPAGGTITHTQAQMSLEKISSAR